MLENHGTKKKMLKKGNIIKLVNLDDQFFDGFGEIRNKIGLIYKKNKNFKDYYHVYVNNKIFLFHLINNVNCEIIG